MQNTIPQLAMIFIGITVGIYVLESRLRKEIPNPLIDPPLCKGWAFIIFPWLVVFATICGLLGSLNGPLYYDLVRHNESTLATIIKTNPANHCSATYHFEVKRRTYVGGEAMCNASIGMTKTVYYDPFDPNTSSLYEPMGALLNELIPASMMGVIVATLVVSMLMKTGLVARRASRVEKKSESNL